MLRVAVERSKTLRRATWLLAPKTQFGQNLTVTGVGFGVG